MLLSGSKLQSAVRCCSLVTPTGASSHRKAASTYSTCLQFSCGLTTPSIGNLIVYFEVCCMGNRSSTEHYFYKCFVFLLLSRALLYHSANERGIVTCSLCSRQGEVSSVSGCAVSTGGSVIFGSNAVCRYFSYKGVSRSPKGVAADLSGTTVEEWLDWEAVTLAPAERLLASSKEAGGSVPTETLEALKHLEQKLTGSWLLEGVSRLDNHDLLLQSSVAVCLKVASQRLGVCKS